MNEPSSGFDPASIGQWASSRDDGVGTPAQEPGDPLALKLLDWVGKAQPDCEKWRKDAREVDRFAAGKHFSKLDYEALTVERRPTAAFNMAQKWLRFIGGIEEQAKLEIQFLPRNPHSDKESAGGDLATKAYNWALQICEGNAERSRAFLDMVRRGMGWTEAGLDRSKDVRGLPFVRRVNGHEMVWDTRARQQNIVDARWVGRIPEVSKSEATIRFHKFKDVIAAASGQSSTYDKPGESTLISEKQAVPVENAQWPPVKAGNVRLIEMQWYDEDAGIYFYDPLEDKEDWLDEDAFKAWTAKYKKLAPRMRAQARKPGGDPGEAEKLANLPDDIEHDRVVMRHYKRCVIIGRTVVWGPHSLPGRRFTFNCMTGQWDDEDEMWYGFFRYLMDPQRYLTKFANRMMEAIVRGSNGGLLAEEESFVNPNTVEERFSKIGSIIYVKRDMLERVKEKPQASIPAGATELFQVCSKSLVDVTGIEPQAAMGMGGGDVPATTMRQRQMASLLLLAQEFNTLRRYQRAEAETVFDILQLVADDRWIRIGDGVDSESLQLVRDPFFLEYDVVLDEGTRDPNVREQYWASIEKLAPTLIRTDNFLPELLDFAPWPPSIRRLIKQRMVQQAEAKQKMAQQGLQTGGRGRPTSIQEIQARVKQIEADAAQKQAKAIQLTEGIKNQRAKILLDTIIKGQQAAQDTQEQKAAAMKDLLMPAGGTAQPVLGGGGNNE